MRIFGARVPRRRAAQAYRRPRGMPSTLTTFRGPTTLDYETLGTPEGFKAPVVYACVSRISRTISQLPRQVRRVSDNQIMPAPFWVESPNSYQGGSDFIKSLVASLLLWGEAFVIPSRTGRGITVAAAVVNPQYVWHRVQGQSVRWYINGLDYTGEMIHMRNDALPGKVRGFAAANTMTPLTETNREAQEFVYKVVEQGGAYQLGVMFPEGVEADDEVVQDTALQIVARHAGAGNAYLPLVLTGGATITPLNQSNADGRFIDLSDMTAKQIAQFWFGIDDTMMGFKSDQPQTYQNAPAIWHRFWAFACKHIAGEIERGLTLLLPRGQRYDLEESEILLGGPHDRAKMVQGLAAVNKTMGLWIYTADELRELTGLHPLPEYEPMATTAPPPVPDGDEDDEDDTGMSDDDDSMEEPDDSEEMGDDDG